MNRSRISPMLIVWLAIQLLLGQQLALTHMIGHIGELVEAEAGHANASDEDREHGSAEALTHVCVTCAVGLAHGVPTGAQEFGLLRPENNLPLPAAVSPAPTFDVLHNYFSRAPPRLQV